MQFLAILFAAATAALAQTLPIVSTFSQANCTGTLLGTVSAIPEDGICQATPGAIALDMDPGLAPYCRVGIFETSNCDGADGGWSEDVPLSPSCVTLILQDLSDKWNSLNDACLLTSTTTHFFLSSPSPSISFIYNGIAFYSTSTLPNLSGTVVDNGCIKLVKLIGAGAFGKVYKARVVASPTAFYAVKCLKRPTLDCKEAKFPDKELALHRRVSSHPNVLTLYGHFMDPEYVFIAMDLSVGGDMFHSIFDGVYRRQPELIKSTFASLVDGVQYCHFQDVFHRDLKPANVLVSAGGVHPLIADFGLATCSEVSMEVNCGTSTHMCPESFKSASSSYRPANSDTWALAIILINMVASLNPWSAAEARDTRWNSFMADPDFLRQILPISRPLNALLKRCLSPNPARRPTLARLRDEVLALPTLLMSDADLEKASPRIRRAAGLDAPAPVAV
ncbi:kinase-like domain-containing protein, partial [Mycena polygramma]